MTRVKKEKKEKTVEPHWGELVNYWHKYTKEKFGEPPTFQGSAPRDLKSIIQSLRSRAETKGIQWTLEVATDRFRLFLDYAYSDNWLREHWMLSNINRAKDPIFFKVAQSRNNEMQ